MSTDRATRLKAGVRAKHREQPKSLPAAGVEEAKEEIHALFVTHGMGEQLRFDATDSIVRGLDLGQDCVIEPRAVAYDEKEDQVTQCLRVTWRSGKQLDIYEAYWAPLTEGQVKLFDAIRFLLSGGWNGFIKVRSMFYRYLFRKEYQFEVPIGSNLLVLAVALCIIVLIGFNILGTAIVVQHLFPGTSQGTANFISTIAVASHNLVVFALILLAARASRRTHRQEPSVLHRFLSEAGMLAFFSAMLVLLLCGWLLSLQVLHFVLHVSPQLASPVLWMLVGMLSVVVLSGIFEWKDASTALQLFFMTCGAVLFCVLSWCLIHAYAVWELTFVPITPVAGANGEATGTGSMWNTIFFNRARPNVGTFAWIALATFFVAGVTMTILEGRRSTDAPKHDDAWIAMTARCLAVLAMPVAVFGLVYRLNLWIHLPIENEGELGVARISAWLVILATGWLARGFIVSYIGDVAAYVSSYKLDRFFKLRKEIRDVALGVAKKMYGAKDADGAPLYTSIAVVAHSLGTVVAYDTLNAMLVLDEADPAKQFAVAPRTRRFITCGSPLDKIAYVYSTLSAETSDAHDVLAASTQPLIDDQDARENLLWINLWSPHDIISGPLEFYGRVRNEIDPFASTPLAAHTEYFSSRLIFERIREWLG